jgi:DNA-directed RNA polymerase subunit K/omega
LKPKKENIKMIYPTIEQLTKGEFNRYELVVGVAKCARIVTDEYVEMKNKAQKMIENHETDKPISALIAPEYKDQKAVKIAVAKLMDGRFKMVRPEE